MLKKIKSRDNLPPLLCFARPVLVMLGLYIGTGIWPFGRNCFLRTDLYHQYVAFFRDFSERLKSGSSLTYAFDIGIGSNYTALYAYYLSSPLHLLIFFGPSRFVFEFIGYMIVLKIGLCGLTMAIYLCSHSRTRWPC